MDSQHRHELKSNDLYEFIMGAKDFWEKHGSSLTWTLLIAASAFAAVRLYSYYSYQTHESAWFDLASSSASADASPDVLRMVAADHGDLAVQALAYLTAADLRMNQTMRSPAEGETIDQSPEDDAAAIEKAASDYRKVLQIATGDNHLLYRLNARLGLAATLEQQAQWDAAREQYLTVAQEAQGRYDRIATLAKSNLEMLPAMQSPIVFGPEPPEPPAPTTPAGQGGLSGPGGGTGFEDLGIGNLDDLLAPNPATPEPATELPGMLDFTPSSDEPANDPLLNDLPGDVDSLDLSPTESGEPTQTEQDPPTTP